MADNLNGIPFSTDDEGIDFPKWAKGLAFEMALRLGVELEFTDVYLVWFNYTLGNWKALCSTSVPDGRYYEVTFDVTRGKAFVDTYLKTHNNEFNFAFEKPAKE